MSLQRSLQEFTKLADLLHLMQKSDSSSKPAPQMQRELVTRANTEVILAASNMLVRVATSLLCPVDLYVCTYTHVLLLLSYRLHAADEGV